MASLGFSKFWHDARKPYEVVYDRAGVSEEKDIPKIEKMDQNLSGKGFSNLLKNLGINFYWICSI